MSADYYMDDENLYVVFYEGLVDGSAADVLGTWTKDASGNKNAELAMVNYTCESVTGDTEYLIVKEGGYYRLKVVVSGENLVVRLQNESGESASDESTLSKLS